MKVLVACEFSGRVRDAFLKRGHDAWSCDVLPTETPGPHLQCDVFDALLLDDWELLIAFPPCTYLTNSANRWLKQPGRLEKRAEAVRFVKQLWASGVPRIAIENPIGHLSTAFMKPTQIIQPWQFGHGETKATCLWLQGLPKLTPTKIVSGRRPRVHFASPGPNRWKERSRTLPGIAEAMAKQWG